MMRICILSNNAGECGRSDTDLVREDTGLLGPSVQGRSKQPIFGWKKLHISVIFHRYAPRQRKDSSPTLKTIKEIRYNLVTQYKQ